jgi:peptidoglycan/LPS O-acetylase OafA/YrhL
MRRVAALDRLRAVALLLMLVQHLTGWFHGDPRAVLPGWEGFALTDACAPAFTVAAGASAVLMAEAMRRKGRRLVDATVVRRYGLLVPLGIALHWVLWRDPLGWGVLETLGLVVVISTVLARRVSAAVLGGVAAAALVVGPVVTEQLTGDGLLTHVLGAGFPLVTYLGFALVGAAGARLVLDGDDRATEALLLGGLLTLVVAATTAAGHPPDRHPGTLVGFVLPGLAGTLLLYGALARWSAPAVVEAVLRPAAKHTLGIFVGHYGLYWALRSVGLLERVPPVPAVVLAVVTAVAVTLVAPLVPPLPWSPRTGWRDQAPKTSASTSGTGRSSWA